LPANLPTVSSEKASGTPASQWAVYASVFSSQRMLAMLLLGFASGLPLALSTGTLQAWLTVEGINIKTIGYFALAGLPYTFKFVWAPLIDRFEPPLLGRRRGWLVVTQLILLRSKNINRGGGRLCGGSGVFLGLAGCRIRCVP
jgi:MFS transporter, PAT family, beta-lactamase induction signal transducer AmpG